MAYQPKDHAELSQRAIGTLASRVIPASASGCVGPLLTATLIWAGVIIFTISALVPINNRIASLNMTAPTPGWKQPHKKWDSLHRIRILLLAVALVALTDALVA
jgi:hypothetical protein